MLDKFKGELEKLKNSKIANIIDLKDPILKPIETMIQAYEESLESPMEDLTTCLGISLTVLLKSPKSFCDFVDVQADYVAKIVENKFGSTNYAQMIKEAKAKYKE